MSSKMEYRSENPKVTMRNARIQTKQTAIPLSSEVREYQRPPVSRNARVQTEITSIGLHNEPVNYQPRPNDARVTIIDDAPRQSNARNVGLDGKATRNRREAEARVKKTSDVRDDPDNLKSGLIIDRGAVMNDDQRREADNREKEDVPAAEKTNNSNAEISPILGYADEPLLPLAEACAPLTDFLHDLSFYVQLALSETPREPPDMLTIDESAAIRLYTIEWDKPHRSLYSMLNFHLKNYDREKLLPYLRYIKLFLTALVKLPCVPPLTVWRGVTKNLSDEFPPGTRVTWWAFSSCTTEMTVLENNMYLGNEGDRTLFSVEVMNGRTIKAHSHFVTEDEILLFSGTHMIVQSQLSPATSLYIIHLKQVIPETRLLEPPFEGIGVIFILCRSTGIVLVLFRCSYLPENQVS